MKVIDLLNKIANGEEVPKKIRINHWCYSFEWVEHLENYYDKDCNNDLMSVLSMSKEEMNYEVNIIEENKKIEKINYEEHIGIDLSEAVCNKINELIEEIEKLKGKSE